MILRYVVNLLLGVDQMVNTILLGHPDETISSRLGRAKRDGDRYRWVKFVRGFVDTLFLFDRGPNGEKHCENSIMPLEQENFRKFANYEIWSWSKK